MAVAKKSIKTTAKTSSKVVASKGKLSLSSLQKKILAVAAIVILGLGGFWLYNDLQDGQLFAASCVNTTYKQNSKSTCVKYAQTMLNYHYSGLNRSYLEEDGAFGPKTKAAVVRLQKERKISQDGIIGKNTWKQICDPRKGPTPSWFTSAFNRAGC